jgi:hypothetical protein
MALYTLCGFITMHMIAFVIICVISNYTCLHDYVVELDLSFLPFNHRYGYSSKRHSMTFITTMVMTLMQNQEDIVSLSTKMREDLNLFKGSLFFWGI